MEEPTPTIREAFVAAYPRYVASLLLDRGVDVVPVIADGIVAGAEVLDGLLTSLEARHPGLQLHSPLELFREALRPVDRALSIAGIEPPDVDDYQRRLLPWDTYSLSPGSSQQLGAEAHDAHLKWGVLKARAHLDRPTAGLRCSEDDSARFLEQLNALGYRVLRLPTDEMVSVGLIDIDEQGVDRIVRSTSEAGAQVIVFGGDPDDTQQVRFKALGATAVVPKHSLLDDLAGHIPMIV